MGNHSYENVLCLAAHFNVNQTERFYPRNYFDKEAQGNLDMVH